MKAYSFCFEFCGRNEIFMWLHSITHGYNRRINKKKNGKIYIWLENTRTRDFEYFFSVYICMFNQFKSYETTKKHHITCKVREKKKLCWTTKTKKMNMRN